MLKLFIACTTVVGIIFAQTQNGQPFSPQDTSYTIYSTYQKDIKKFPFIEIAQSQINEELLTDTNLVYASYGSRNLRLDIFYHYNKTQLYPAVILVHGGGWRSGDKSQQIPLAQEMASAGFVTAAVEYRLSPEALYPAAIIDLKSAIRWMYANSLNYSIDTNRIAVLGCSSGGHLVAMLGVTNCNQIFEGHGDYLDHSSNVHAVIDIDGILDFTDPTESGKDVDPKKPSVGKLWLGYSFKENPEIWCEASPINYVDQNTSPFLFINSSNERFHAGREIFIEKLNCNNIYSEIHTFPNTPHSFWFFHPWFRPMTKIVIEFLNKIFR